MPTNLYGPGDNFDLETQPRAAGADPQGCTRRSERRRATRRRSGAPARRGASSCTSTTCADACVVPARRRYSRRASHVNVGTRRGPHDRRARRALVADVVGFAGRLALRRDQARRHAAQAAGRLAPARARLAARRSRSRRARARLPLVPRAGRARRRLTQSASLRALPGDSAAAAVISNRRAAHDEHQRIDPTTRPGK